MIELFKVNVVGQIHLFNLVIPLILKGRAKKIVGISSGFAAADLVRKYNVHNSAPYAISKAAFNMAIVEFSAQYAKEGVLFISISPGTIDTGHFDHGKTLSFQLDYVGVY